jgi:hypothetical protein
MVACYSRHSRNRGFGERVGRGEKLSVIAASPESFRGRHASRRRGLSHRLPSTGSAKEGPLRLVTRAQTRRRHARRG